MKHGRDSRINSGIDREGNSDIIIKYEINIVIDSRIDSKCVRKSGIERKCDNKTNSRIDSKGTGESRTEFKNDSGIDSKEESERGIKYEQNSVIDGRIDRIELHCDSRINTKGVTKSRESEIAKNTTHNLGIGTDACEEHPGTVNLLFHLDSMCTIS